MVVCSGDFRVTMTLYLVKAEGKRTSSMGSDSEMESLGGLIDLTEFERGNDQKGSTKYSNNLPQKSF